MIGRFLKNVLIPEKVGSYYLIPQRIVGFDINKTSIHVTQLLLHGKHISLEKFIDQPLELEATAPYQERVSKTIKTILTKLDRYDALRTSISSSMAIFKELTLPFTDSEKISMVLNYEIEPFLPFPITQRSAELLRNRCILSFWTWTYWLAWP
jgi:Tfp pilus assembly PilM family ATPase